MADMIDENKPFATPGPSDVVHFTDQAGNFKVALTNEQLAANLQTVLDGTFVTRTGETQAARTAGDGMSSAVGLTHAGDSGFIMHLTGDVGGAGALIALGTDAGTMDGLLISHKNSAQGIELICQPGSGVGALLSGYGAGRVMLANVYKGNPGVHIQARLGQAFSDGVSVAADATFTSASANFTAGDVGATIQQLTTSGAAPSGSIPAGTTIASVTNSTTVELSKVATSSGSTIKFVVGGRAPDSTQALLTVLDEGGADLVEISRGGYTATMGHTMTADAVDTEVLVVSPIASQTVEIFRVDGDAFGAGAISVISNGRTLVRFGSIISNQYAPGATALTVQTFGAGSTPLTVKGTAAQTSDQLRITDSTNAVQSRFNNLGVFITKANSAPSDGSLAAGEMALWFDPTSGAGAFKVKGKELDGTVHTATLAVT